MRTMMRGALVIVTAALLVFAVLSPGAQAHSKVINVVVSCVAPDPSRPLAKACTAVLRYLDGDPVPDARLMVIATRQGAAAVAPIVVRFTPLEQQGMYSAAFTLPAYGRWQIRFRVREPESGEAELQEELLPPAPGAVAGEQARLQIVFRFGLVDVRNIAMRTIHLLAAAAWFALTALVLVLSIVLAPEQRRRALRRIARDFPWAAGVSLVALAASGMYTARYNAPTPAPGLFAPAGLSRLPFGNAYLAAFFVKMGLMLAILAATIALALALRRTYGGPMAAIAGGAGGPGGPRFAAERPVLRLAGANIILGLLTFVNVVVLGYLHMIAHVGAAAGGR